MSEVNKELSALLIEFPEYEFDFVKLLQAAKEREIPVGYADIRALSRLYPKLAEFLFPELISNFIVSLLKDFQPKKIYDPWVKTGSLLSILVEKFKPSDGAFGMIDNEASYFIETSITKNQNITWQVETLSDEEVLGRETNFTLSVEKGEKERDTTYDFFVCVPQFGIRSKWTFDDERELLQGDKDEKQIVYEKNIEEMHNAYEIYDAFISYALLRIAGTHSKLSDSGSEVGIFIVSSHFFNIIKEENTKLANLNKNLHDFSKSLRDDLDCYIDAAFQLPNGIFDPFTSIPLYLILVKNGKSALKNHKLFVGQLSGDESQNAILIQNYKERRAARIPQQGALIEENEFKGLDALINEYEIKQLVARSGFVAYPFNQISVKVNFLGEPKINNNFSASDKCIYLPIVGDSPAVTSVNEMTLQSQEYVQLVYEYQPDVVDAHKDFLNSPEGLEFRKSMNWEEVRLSRVPPFRSEGVFVEINFYGKQNFQEKPLEDNFVYLPIIGNSVVVTIRDEFILEPREYVQIILDPEKAFAPYFAVLFNSRLGLKIRESLFLGLKIPKITKSSLEASVMYFPNIETQKEVMRINADIVNLSAELSSLQNQLWDSPNEVVKIEKKIRQFSQEKGWEIWLEDLPFPMASILWAYLSTVDPKDKLEHISHFFEASSQFFAMICLSAVAQDKEFYHSNQKQWIEENPKDKGWYKNMTFGSWRKLHSSLAKFIRVLLSKEDTKSKCLSLFGNADEHFIQIVAGKRLIGIFETANEYRNHWIGHRGRLSDEDAGKQAAAFEDLLAKMREVVGDSFSQILLLSPRTSEYADGIYEYTVKTIKGTRTEFRERVIQSIIPLDKKKLYILSELQVKPIEILPFGKLMHSPKTAQNAFYFYSRFDNEGVRWVSYHFEDEPDMKIPDPEMIDLMKELFD